MYIHRHTCNYTQTCNVENNAKPFSLLASSTIHILSSSSPPSCCACVMLRFHLDKQTKLYIYNAVFWMEVTVEQHACIASSVVLGSFASRDRFWKFTRLTVKSGYHERSEEVIHSFSLSFTDSCPSSNSYVNTHWSILIERDNCLG